MSNDELRNIVWVNKLPLDVTESDVTSHFSPCGEVVNVVICSSKNRNYAYCFVEFKSEEELYKALNTPFKKPEDR